MAFDAVDFSDKAPFSGPSLPCFSPNGKYVALAQDYRLVVREVDTLAVVGLHSCLDRIESLSWSPNGDMVLCLMPNRGTVQVFNVEDPEWSCSITEGLAGICHAMWCPSGKEVLLVADFQVKMTIWSLIDQSCLTLPSAKLAEAGLGFSPDGKMLAVLERTECKDWLSIYHVSSWVVPAVHVSLPTVDAADIAWASDGSSIAAWDSAAQGPLLCVVDTNGKFLTVHKGDTYGLGFKSTGWSPSGQLMALGTYEQDVSVLNHVTWTPLASFHHATTISGPATVVVYTEHIELPLSFLKQKKLEELTGGLGANGRPKPGSSGPSSVAASTPRTPRTPTKRPPMLPRLNIPPPGGTFRAANSPPKASGSLSSRGEGGEGSARFKSPRSFPISGSMSARGPGEVDAGGRFRSPRTNLPLSARGRPTSITGQLDISGLLQEDNEAAISRYIISELPARLAAVRPPTDRPNPKTGISLAVWSPDGTFLATRCDDRPNVVWIWDATKLELASVLVQAAAVKSAEWAPSLRSGSGPEGNRLALVCGTGRVYFWSPRGAHCSKIPVQGMKALAVKWRPDGGALMVASKDALVCAYLNSHHRA